MKRETLISLVALLIAFVALIVSISNRQSPTGDKEHDVSALVDAALKEKEANLVRGLAPKMTEVYQDFLGTEEAPFEKQPDTIAELLAPMIRVIQEITNES